MAHIYRALIVGSLLPWLAVACISGEDTAPPNVKGGASTSAGGGDGQGGSVIGNTGGSRAVSNTTGGAPVGSAGSHSGTGGSPTGTGGAISGTTGGVVSAGTGGAGGLASTGGAASTAVPPSGGLGVYVATQNGIAASNALQLHLEIINTSKTPQDLASVTMRYWYTDDGWANKTLVMQTDYVSIGHSNLGTASFVGSTAVSPAQTGADHYYEFSFTGTLAATGDQNQNDIFHVEVELHPSDWQGTPNVTNDYSAMSTVGYDDHITLYSAGTLIWGTEPGSTAMGGTGGASSISGSSSISGGTASTGGDSNAGGVATTGGSANTGGSSSSTGGAQSTGGDSSTGGAVTTGGNSSSGGAVNTGGAVTTGGDTSTGGAITTGGDSSTGGDASAGGDTSTGGDTSAGGDTSTLGGATVGGNSSA